MSQTAWQTVLQYMNVMKVIIELQNETVQFDLLKTVNIGYYPVLILCRTWQFRTACEQRYDIALIDNEQ